MSIRDGLRRAGEDGSRVGLEKTREHIEDAETTLRRSMRLHPQPGTLTSSHPHDDQTKENADGLVRRRPIVSIDGEDVDENEDEDVDEETGESRHAL